MQDGIIEIACEATEHASPAYHENAIPVIQEIVISNATEEDVLDIELMVNSRPLVVKPLTLLIDPVPAGGTHHIATPDIHLDAGLLSSCGALPKRVSSLK